MSAPTIAALAAGDRLPDWVVGKLTRTTLALYAGGSGDHVPLHIDSDFARKVARMDDVIGHGMLTMAYLGRYLVRQAPQSHLRKFSTRFVGMSKPGDVIHCEGKVVAARTEGSVRIIEVEIAAKRDNNEVLATGSAQWSFEGEELIVNMRRDW